MATEEQWARYTGGMFKGKPSGNAEFAMTCRAVPLEANAILKLLYDNLEYFGDPYYRPLTEPVEMRVEEYLDTLPK